MTRRKVEVTNKEDKARHSSQRKWKKTTHNYILASTFNFIFILFLRLACFSSLLSSNISKVSMSFPRHKIKKKIPPSHTCIIAYFSEVRPADAASPLHLLLTYCWHGWDQPSKNFPTSPSLIPHLPKNFLRVARGRG